MGCYPAPFRKLTIENNKVNVETEKVEESKENVDTNNVASESNSELTSVNTKENIFTKLKNFILLADFTKN